MIEKSGVLYIQENGTLVATYQGESKEQYGQYIVKLLLDNYNKPEDQKYVLEISEVEGRITINTSTSDLVIQALDQILESAEECQ